MSFQNELHDTAQTAMSNPKVMAAVSGATSAMGAATATDLISGVMSYAAMFAGIVATVLLGRVHWAEYKNRLLQTKLLRKQLRDLGVDPDSEA